MNDGWIAVAADTLAGAERALPPLRARAAALPAGSPGRLALAAEAALWEQRAASARRLLDACEPRGEIAPLPAGGGDDGGGGDDTPPPAPAVALPRRAA